MMSFIPKGLENNKINVSSKVTTLNPNAAEFVPSALRSTCGNTNSADSSRVDSTGTSGKAILGHSESSILNNSDDEEHQYWHHQLPDDITPDFKAMGEEEVPSPGQISLAGLSIRNALEPSKFSSSMTSETFGTRHGRSLLGTNNLILNGNVGYSGATYNEDQSSAARIVPTTNSWDKQFINGDQRLTRGMGGIEGQHYNGNSSASFVNNMLGDQAVVENSAINPVDLLSSKFPGFSAESLADVYYANGCDLHATIEMIGQLELQGDAGFSKNLYSKSFSSPSLSKLDLQSLPLVETHNGMSKYTRDLHQVPDTYRSTSGVFRGASEFASTARNISPLDGSHWKHERNGPADGSIGSSRTSQLLASSYNGHGKLLYGDKSPSPGARTAPVWLETGEAVANMYTESREEARDLARLRDACLEKAGQAYLIGNKALARELNEKGQFYNTQMKAAQLKAGDTVYRKRDPVSYELQGFNRGGHDGLIDLQGLHVSDALHVLKHELNVLRNTARSSGQRLQATIRLGTRLHFKDARVSPRLPLAVEQVLLEEGLPYTQPQPGLLHVVIY